MIPYLTATPSRREVIDYSKPLSYVKYSMIVAMPQEPPRAFIFLKPFKREVIHSHIIKLMYFLTTSLNIT